MTRFGRAVFAAALALGCTSHSDDAPPPTCVGDCGLPPGLSSVPQTDGGDGGPGEGGSSGAGVVLTGSVEQINDETNFVMAGPFTGTATLQADAADLTTVRGTWDGSNPFVLQNVLSAAPAWVLATPQNALAVDALPAMEPVNTKSPNAQGQVTADIGLVRSTTIDQIFSFTTTPLANDATKGQIILRLVDKTSTSAPLSGVSVSVPSAQAILYAASGSFSDVASATDPTGVIVLANVGAVSWPGALVSIEFSGTRGGGAQVRAVTGAVTLTTLAL